MKSFKLSAWLSGIVPALSLPYIIFDDNPLRNSEYYWFFPIIIIFFLFATIYFVTQITIQKKKALQNGKESIEISDEGMYFYNGSLVLALGINILFVILILFSLSNLWEGGLMFYLLYLWFFWPVTAFLLLASFVFFIVHFFWKMIRNFKFYIFIIMILLLLNFYFYFLT